MAQTNYQFEKRKRELERKRKQEAKQQRKSERKNRGAAEAPAQPPPHGTDGS